MSLQKDLLQLVEAKVISQETADKIQAYYKINTPDKSNRIFIAFGILGAMLIGLGIILIIAHNWDTLSQTIKSVLAFIPLLIGQVICSYVILKKRHNTDWRESAAVFLFFAIGASLALISQIYHLPLNLSNFMLRWSLLALPLVYIMPSSMVGIFYIGTITFFAVQQNNISYYVVNWFIYWLLLLALMPHYIKILQKHTYSNFTNLYNWLIPLSMLIAVGLMATQQNIILLAYGSLFSLYFLVSKSPYYKSVKSTINSYNIIGSVGIIVILLILSFTDFHKSISYTTFTPKGLLTASDFYATLVCSTLAILLLIKLPDSRLSQAYEKAIGYGFLIIISIYIIAKFSILSIILANIAAFAIGIMYIQSGAKKNHLGLLNYGLLIISTLIAIRFLDADISFVIRGVAFVILGIGFFVANYSMLKIKNKHEKR